MIKAYFLPHSLDEALDLLAEHGSELMVSAGGTITRMLINEGILMPEKVMGLRKVGLNTISVNGGMHIGATATLTQMTQQTTIPLLQTAAHHVAAWAVRNMGTVGGNIFARQPHGDLAVALLALDAEVKIESTQGEWLLPLRKFYETGTANGSELLTEVQVKKPVGKTAYVKYARRQVNAPAIVTVAAHIQQANGVVKAASIALGGVSSHAMRATNAENLLVGSPLNAESIAAAADAAAQECDPATDEVASEWYRRQMVNVFVRRALEQI